MVDPDPAAPRFAPWGDAADLLDILDVRRAGPGSYVGVGRDYEQRPVVEGSQMLAQALVAACREEPGRRPVSAHMVFIRAADSRGSLRFEVTAASRGRSFSTFAVDIAQDDQRRATGLVLLDGTAPGVIRHGVAPPDVAHPDELAPFDMGVTGRHIRVVADAYRGESDAPVGPPVIDAWVRFDAVPDDPVLHTALMAQFTGHLSIAAALRSHAGIGERDAHRTLSTGVSAINLAIHADVRADRWMLYHHHSTFAGDGMTHAECRVHDEGGALLASFTVDAMVRPMSRPADPRTTM